MSPSRSRRRRPRKKKSNNGKIILAVVLLAVVVVVVVIGVVMLGNNSSEVDLSSGNQSDNPSDGSSDNQSGNPSDGNLPSSNQVMLMTSLGNILIELRDDMPITTSNFKKLVQDGVYDGTIFHRVVNLPGNLQIIQGGDPSTGPWTGGTIPAIQDEFSDNPENNRNERATIAMANAGPNTGSSQFFINAAYHAHLDNNHPVFGDIIEGMDVVDQILNVETSGDPFNRPLDDVTLIAAYIVE
jgi:peptidylprolyl isomerase